MQKIDVRLGDCLDVLDSIEDGSIDLIYLDPPFFTQKVQKLSTRSGDSVFSFRDIWGGRDEYASYMFDRIAKLRLKLKPTGSLFFHCDKSASHIVRLLLDYVFGDENFQSEIIWHFKRWSNSQNGLLPSHQNIFWYSAGPDYKFNRVLGEYSASTNVDQLMQQRMRDGRGKTVYKRDEDGVVVSSGAKQGVPLADVWEIPYLNPKAKERVGYPTQKPVLLIEKIIEIVTNPGDIILDPFCGSGTTLVAAKLLMRNAIGIDISPDAITITNARLEVPFKTESRLLELGRDAYEKHDESAAAVLNQLDYVPVQRNKGIDGVLKATIDSLPVFIRVQRDTESISDTVAAIRKAAKKKGGSKLIAVQTKIDATDVFVGENFLDGVAIIQSTGNGIASLILDGGSNWQFIA